MLSSRRLLSTVGCCLAVALLGSACTGRAADPERVDTCDGLVPVGAALVADYLEELHGLPIDVVTGELPPPEALAELTTRGRELDARAARLGCSVDELNAAIAAAVSDLRADDDVGALFLEIVRAGVIDTLPSVPPGTTTVP